MAPVTDPMASISSLPTLAGPTSLPSPERIELGMRTPRWPMVAFDASRRCPRAWVPVLCSPLNVCFVVVLSLVALAARSILLGSVLMASQVFLAALAERLPSLRAYAERRQRAFLDGWALHRRDEWMAMMRTEDRPELERLEGLVEDLRGRVDGAGVSISSDDLDRLLCRFVESAIQLRHEWQAFRRTEEDRPRAVSATCKKRGERLTRMRVRARARSRQRLQALENHLGEIGELIRLVHEDVHEGRRPSLAPGQDDLEERLLSSMDLGRRIRGEVDAELAG